jgi:predicted transcriptional regulator of viral defense system
MAVMAVAGLSGANRAFVAQLNRELRGPFTPADAAAATGVDHARAVRLLRHLAAEGWVARLQRGLYTTVPLEAEDPENWGADPWAVAMAVLAPGYVGGWTALHHWDLTDQIFSTTVFVTARPVPRRRRTIGGARFELRHRSESALFGTRRVWREGTPVEASDRERTLVDCLDDPSLGGGLRHTTEALAAYAERPDVSWQRLVEYGDRLGNRTVFKRLGYVAETLGFGDDELIEGCLGRVSAGVGRLDPGRPGEGAITARWGLRINTRVDA